MPFSRIPHTRQYTSDDWRIMYEALKIAAQTLDRDIKTHEHSDRLARAVMDFFKRGIRDTGVLATLAVSRERSIEHHSRRELRVTSSLYGRLRYHKEMRRTSPRERTIRN
jgi:hypothetical protein